MVRRKPRELIDGKLLCPSCSTWVKLEDYPQEPSRLHGVSGTCKECAYACQKRTRDMVKDKYFQVEYKYGITKEYYDQLVENQNNKCAICNCEERRMYKNRIKNLSVDHDHDTGRVRGLLCHSCNSALGFLEDNIDYLLNAVEYLRKHEREINE